MLDVDEHVDAHDVPLWTERCPSDGVSRRFVYHTATGRCDAIDARVELRSMTSILTQLRAAATRVWLPRGYPDTVSADYAAYQAWDTVQAFVSAIVGAVATQAVFRHVGVGDGAATPLAATITWLSSSGCGMLAKVAFTACKSTALNADCKRWRLVADALNDAAMLTEIGAPHILTAIVGPTATGTKTSVGAMQTLLCATSVMRSLVGVAGGATRVAITVHQASSADVCEVAAKDESQEVLVNLIALIVNLAVLPILDACSSATWCVLLLTLVTIHLVANYNAVTSLQFNTFNAQRLRLALTAAVATVSASSVKNAPDSTATAMSIAAINAAERVVPLLSVAEPEDNYWPIVDGASLNAAAVGHFELTGVDVRCDVEAMAAWLRALRDDGYIVVLGAAPRRAYIVVSGATTTDTDDASATVRRYMHAVLLADRWRQRRGAGDTKRDAIIESRRIRAEVERYADMLYACGWRTDDASLLSSTSAAVRSHEFVVVD